MYTYAIHEANLERLHKKINRIRTKCERYGCDFYYEEIGEEFRVLDEGTDNEHVARFILVKCEGTAVVNGWKFAATLEHTDHGNIIRNALDIEIPDKYKTCGPECEHCKSKRHRKDTYIVYNEETEEFKQVGSSCVCDFTGGLSAEGIAAYIELFDELIQGESAPSGYSRVVYYNVDEILRYAAQFVKEIGYVSTQSWGTSTKEEVIAAWSYDNHCADKDTVKHVEAYRARWSPDYRSDSLQEYVRDMKEYILSCNEQSNYIQNLQVIARSEYIAGRDLGYAVSMVACYSKHIQQQEVAAERAKKHQSEVECSHHVGQVKDRITLNNPEVVAITSWENQFGVTIRYKLMVDGNVYMWDSSSGINLDNEIDTVVGTVKKHDEWNGVKQTWLTRCKVTYREKAHAPASTELVEFYKYL